jgi:hypothetical protein
MFKSKGTYYDFTSASSTSSGGLEQSVINIIESNTGTQVNVRVGYTEITWDSNGLPSMIEKYSDSSKANKIYTITPVFIAGLPSTVTTVNHDDGITEVATFVFTNGLLSSVSKNQI